MSATDPLRAADGGRRDPLRLLALACAALLLATVALSAMLRLSQAGLGCADWPACYGEAARSPGPPVAAAPLETAARLGHRVVATLALALILAMVIHTRTGPLGTATQRRLSAALLALALALAALGVATPGARAPAIAIGNLLGGFAMLALCWRLVGAADRDAAAPAMPLRRWCRCGLALLAVQIATGALLSTSFAALSCGDLADCQRAAAAGGWDWRLLNPWREPRFDLSAAHVNPDGALVQWLHRVGSALVVAVVLGAGVTALRLGYRRAGLTLLLLTGAQMTWGLLALAWGLPLPLVLLHNLTAAALLAALARLA